MTALLIDRPAARPLPEMVAATVAAGQPACTAPGIDPEMFFPETDDVFGIAWAKRVCAACLFRAECLEGALERAERYGVWGGLSEDERPRALIERLTTRPAVRAVIP